MMARQARAGAGPRKRRTRRVTVVVALVVLLAAGIIGYLLVYKQVLAIGADGAKDGPAIVADAAESAAQPTEDEAKKSGSDKKADSESDTLGPLYSFDPFIVNVAETSGHRYLKCTMSVELDNSAGTAEVKSKDPRLRDAIIDVLSSKTLPDLDPGAPRDELRRELADTISSLLTKTKVKRVFFSEFVLQ